MEENAGKVPISELLEKARKMMIEDTGYEPSCILYDGDSPEVNKAVDDFRRKWIDKSESEN